MIINLLPKKEIFDFESEIGVELIVNEQSPSDAGIPRFTVIFNGGEVTYAGMLSSVYGDASTIDAAILDYCKLISGKRMVFGSYTKYRKEISIPILTHTKLLGK